MPTPLPDKPFLLATRQTDAFGPPLAGRDDVVHLPLLAIHPLEPDAAGRKAIAELDHYHAVILVSGNAVRIGLALLGERWPQWPVGVHWIVMGPQSRAAALPFGIDPLTPDDGFDSEAALRMPALQDVAGKAVLIVRGQEGRPLLAESLAARGARVDMLCCYHRVQPALDEQAARAVLGHPALAAIQVLSGETLDNLLALAARVQISVKGVPLLVISDRVRRIALEKGFSQVLALNDASDTALLAAWEELGAG